MNGEPVITQGDPDSSLSNREVAMAVCSSLQPLLGCYNACCNYPRAFEVMQICCSADENGRSVFDCGNNYGGKNLLEDCREEYPSNDYPNPDEFNCDAFRDVYLNSPDYGTAKLFTRNSDGRTVVMLPDSVMEALYPRFRGRCDYYLVANCIDSSALTYKGPAALPISGPTEPADCGEEPNDPCMGTCEGDRQCVVAGNGALFCVDCSAFMKKKGPKVDVECCGYDEVKRRCVSAIKGDAISKCKRDQRIFVVEDEDERVAATFMRSKGYVCGNPRDFRKNRKGCSVVVKKNRVAKCFERN